LLQLYRLGPNYHAGGLETNVLLSGCDLLTVCRG
jgi:hypothetical protein